MNDMKIFKVSHGTNFFNYENHILMLENNLVSVHPNTAAKGTSSQTQYANFVTARKGDVVFICRSNESVDVIGMLKDERPLYSLIKDHYDNDWIDRELVVLFESKNNSAHHKGREKWWLPGDNSTCNEVKKEDYKLFEDMILNPVFEKTIDDLKQKRLDELKKLDTTINDVLELQIDFNRLLNNDLDIFDVVNNLSEIEKLKVYYNYGSRDDADKRPVVLLRRKLIEFVVENKETPLTKEIVDTLKKEVATKFDKNVFHAWSSYFRVLYPFYYDQYKANVIKLLENLVDNIRKDLGIEDFTKDNIVHFDGAQNQGSDHVWFAIYNSSYKNQKEAKQLFFSVNQGKFIFGLRSHKNPSINKSTTTDKYDYSEILSVFREFIDEIKNDDITKFKDMNDLKELLEFKKQIILQGPPGTGKTYTAKDLAEFTITDTVSIDKIKQAEFINTSDQIEIIQFHPAYTYEDFIRGIVTEPIDGKLNYVPKDKLFLELVDKAKNDKSKKPYVLIIDEINRANLSSVLGELIYALEYRNQTFKSMYADKKGDYEVSIPDNLYIIGTMNTADRSIGHLDYALRRRFAFYDILPKVIKDESFEQPLFEIVSKLFVKEIKDKFDELVASEHLGLEFQDRPQDIWLGHSYFFKKEDVDFSLRIKYEIVPILLEYIKDGILNNSDEVKGIINEISNYKILDVNS
ncbi:McrB family protein [Epilithonimonas hungarica]|uniref:McrB family protein n=1 Tax=Epilithonimonas hungarica TaxID=454006 RepID=UPI0027D7FC92|nr:AAA family ATPase [Epilithonimonas hungarica]